VLTNAHLKIQRESPWLHYSVVL